MARSLTTLITQSPCYGASKQPCVICVEYDSCSKSCGVLGLQFLITLGEVLVDLGHEFLHASAHFVEEGIHLRDRLRMIPQQWRGIVQDMQRLEIRVRVHGALAITPNQECEKKIDRFHRIKEGIRFQLR